MKLASRLEEAANRAEVSVLLLRAGFRIYRPEADVEGEDLIIRRPDGRLFPVQMKARPLIDPGRYGEKDLLMLFPDPQGSKPGRTWYLILHDDLVPIFQAQRKLEHKPGDQWSYSAVPKKMREALEPHAHQHWISTGPVAQVLTEPSSENGTKQ